MPSLKKPTSSSTVKFVFKDNTGLVIYCQCLHLCQYCPLSMISSKTVSLCIIGYNIIWYFSVWPHQMCFMNADSWTAEPRTWFHKLNDQWAWRSSQSSILYKHAVILPLVVFIWSVHDLYCIFPKNYYPNAYSIVAYILLQLMLFGKCVF
jgi:hypothetical protein